MEEVSVKFETAKLAKKIGLVHPKKMHSPYYNKHGELNGDVLDEIKLRIKDNTHEVYTLYAPTQSLLQKWLREVHNISVLVYWNEIGIGYGYSRLNLKSKTFISKLSITFDTYEEALELGLQESLKLLL